MDEVSDTPPAADPAAAIDAVDPPGEPMLGRIVAVVGNTAAGKTTLVNQLCQRYGCASGMEQHEQRPFQRLFAEQRARFALANQVDFLLYRAEQELTIRRSGRIGFLDGGLDLDFHVFTRLFRERGYLGPEEYALCERLYRFIRSTLPRPELTVWLQAPLATLAARFAARGRPLSIATEQDLAVLDRCLREWLEGGSAGAVQVVDAAAEGAAFEQALSGLNRELRRLGLNEAGPREPGGPDCG